LVNDAVTLLIGVFVIVSVKECRHAVVNSS
jgi:hypothetical protein